MPARSVGIDVKLLIVDDQILFREGLAAIVQSEPDIEIVGLAGTVQEAIALDSEMKPDIVLTGFMLSDGSGIDLTRAILTQRPSCKIVFLSAYDEEDKLLAAVRSGAKGYLSKSIRPAKLVLTLRAVMRGEGAISRPMTLRVMEELARTQSSPPDMREALYKLSHREQEVLRELATGATNPEIARRLSLSENTVKFHIHLILEKLGLSDRWEAAELARQQGVGRIE